MDYNPESPDAVNWKAVYELPFCCTKAFKLNIFQFKLLHRRRTTNYSLNKIGLREDGNRPYHGFRRHFDE